MISALDAAKYIASLYKIEHHEVITEMKLHKLLYFAQREALIEGDSPLFSETFKGWKYGPVIPSIRYAFSEICQSNGISLDQDSKRILDVTLRRYGEKSPWSLSRLSHGEYSWQKSREGISEYENSDNDIKLEDIQIDAKRIKERRMILSEIRM